MSRLGLVIVVVVAELRVCWITPWTLQWLRLLLLILLLLSPHQRRFWQLQSLSLRQGLAPIKPITRNLLRTQTHLLEYPTQEPWKEQTKQRQSNWEFPGKNQQVLAFGSRSKKRNQSEEVQEDDIVAYKPNSVLIWWNWWVDTIVGCKEMPKKAVRSEHVFGSIFFMYPIYGYNPVYDFNNLCESAIIIPWTKDDQKLLELCMDHKSFEGWLWGLVVVATLWNYATSVTN